MMKSLLKDMSWFLAVFVILAASKHADAQIDSSRYLQDKIVNYLDENPEERLFLHISKPHYLTGETLWFRVYKYSSRNHIPFALSKVVYIELLNSANEPVVQTKLKIGNSGEAGSIYLPTTLNSGRYKVVAYTKWMRNFDESQFFTSEIEIINPFKRLNLQSEVDTHEIDLQFFPEGGYLVDGIQTKIAFKSTDRNGKGVFFNGLLINGSDTIVKFTPNKLGIGSFELKPEISAEYQVIITDETGREMRYPFPEVQNSGYAMRVEPLEKSYSIVIESNNPAQESQGSFLYLSGLSRDRFVFFQSKAFYNGKTEFKVPLDSLSEGINQFTVFNNKGIPICERKVFRFPENGMEITTNVDNVNPGLRKPVEIEVRTMDRLGIPLSADLSISVYATDSGIHDDLVSFESYMWLLSELKGYIENPGYYFKTESTERFKDMDDLMLSQGWSRYDIQEILNRDEDSTQFIPEFIDQVFSANIRSRDSGAPVPDQLVTLSFPNNYAQLFADRSDKKGRLNFLTWNVFGSEDMIMEYKSDGGPEVEISVDPQFHKMENNFYKSPFFVSQAVESFLIEQSINMQIENIFEQTREFENLSDTSSFYGIPDASYLLDDFTRFPVMEEVMREYVYGVNVRRQDGKFVFKVLNIPRNEIMNEEPLVLLDGVPVNDTDRIMAIDPLNIRKIDVIHSKYYYGSLDCNGIVAFYSYNSDLPDLPLNTGVIRQRFQGFQQNKSFYKPKYDTQESISSRIPDFRNQLHWDPQITTDQNGITKVLFYTSDKSGTYRIQMHGLAQNGLAGSFAGSIQVR